jgi:hypothetical protein
MNESAGTKADRIMVKIIDALLEKCPEFRGQIPCATCTRPEGAHARAEVARLIRKLQDHVYNGAPSPEASPQRDERGFYVPTSCCRRKPRPVT